MPNITRYARSLTHNNDKAQDLIQDTLERAWKFRHQYDETRTKPVSWLFAIMKNKFVANLQRDYSVRASNVDNIAAISRESVEDAGYDAVHAVQALASLEPIDRFILLATVQGASYAYVAECLEMCEGTVKWRASQARNYLRTLL